MISIINLHLFIVIECLLLINALKIPPITDIGKFKTITTSIPEKQACGRHGLTDVYCEPPFQISDFNNKDCEERQCTEKCPGRDHRIKGFHHM